MKTVTKTEWSGKDYKWPEVGIKGVPLICCLVQLNSIADYHGLKLNKLDDFNLAVEMMCKLVRAN